MAQELRRDQPVRLPNPSAQPFVAALRTARFFAVVFFWVTMVCVLAYVAAFVLTEWVGLYDIPPAAAAPAAAPTAPEPAEAKPSADKPAAGASWLGILEGTASAAPKPEPRKTEPKEGESGPTKFFGVPATPVKEGAKAAPGEASKEPPPESPASKEAETKGEVVAKPETPLPEKAPLTPEQRRVRAEYYYDVSLNILKPLRVIGVLSSFLLGATLFLYLQIALLGRLAGIRQLTNALFLLLLFFATVVPWENIFEGFRVNVFYDFLRLVATHADRAAGNTGDLWTQVRYFARFFGLPIGSAVLLAWSGIQFAAGYAESVLANE
jgi:hypothetical protein